MFLHVSVNLFTGGLSLCPGGLHPRGSLCWGGLCPGCLCPGGVSVQGGLCLGVSVQGVSVQGSLSRGVLCPGVSVQGGLCHGDPCTVMSGRYASYWNAFLFSSYISLIFPLIFKLKEGNHLFLVSHKSTMYLSNLAHISDLACPLIWYIRVSHHPIPKS